MLDDYFDGLRKHLVTKNIRPTPKRSTANNLSSAAVRAGASNKVSSRTTTNSVPESTNISYHNNLLFTVQTDIPEAGKGVIIIKGVKRGSILGLYLNHPNLKRVTKDRIHRSDNTSVYAVEFEGLYRDAYNPTTDNVCILVACFNDPVNETKDNSEIFVRSDKAHLLTVRGRTDILDGIFGYLPYGGSYWCNSTYSEETLVRAIHP